MIEEQVQAEAENEEVQAEEVVDDKSADDNQPQDDSSGDWRALITNDDAKKAAERFNSLDDVFKSQADLRKELSQRLKIPGKDASDEDVAKFRKAIGASDKVEDYSKLPEGMELDETDQALFDAAAAIGLESGLPVSVHQQFVGKYLELVEQARSQMAVESKKFFEDSTATLDKEWGRDKDANLAMANRAMMQMGGEELKDWLNGTKAENGQPLANQPELVRLFAKIGRQMSEDGAMMANDAETIQNATSKHADLTRQMHEARARGDHNLAKKLDQERSQLSAQLDGNSPIVGAGGRAA